MSTDNFLLRGRAGKYQPFAEFSKNKAKKDQVSRGAKSPKPKKATGTTASPRPIR